MTLEEMKARVIFQINADIDDLGDYEPHMDGYINTGYDKLLFALMNMHLKDGPFDELVEDYDFPKLPEWMHPAITDFATWLVYRNGNPQKQSRGMRFLESFQEVLMQVKSMAGKYAWDDELGALVQLSNTTPQFFNIPTP